MQMFTIKKMNKPSKGSFQLTKTSIHSIFIAAAILSFISGRSLYFYHDISYNQIASKQHPPPTQCDEDLNVGLIVPFSKSRDQKQCILEMDDEIDNGCKFNDRSKHLNVINNEKLKNHHHWHNNNNVLAEFLDSPNIMLDLVNILFHQAGLQYSVRNECHIVQPTGLICTFASQDIHFAIQSRIVNGLPTLDYYLNGDESETKQLYQIINEELLYNESLFYSDERIKYHREGKVVYNEALTHPILFAHPEPKKVAILKGRDQDWVLKEVLKHKSIQHVSIYEHVDLKLTSLQVWQNCSNFFTELKTQRCQDDERVHLHKEKAFSPLANSGKDFEPFDVAIMNIHPAALTKSDEKACTDIESLKNLFESLSPNGMVVFPFSIPKNSNSSQKEWQLNLMKLIEEVGFQSVKVYEESHKSWPYKSPLAFVIAMKSTVDQAWYNTFSEITIELHNRLIRTKIGTNTLKYIDSAVIKKYQMPSKVIENLHCKSTKSYYCQALDRVNYKTDIPLSSLDVRMSSVGGGSGRGLFTNVKINKGNTIGYETSVHPVYIPPITIDTMLKYENYGFDIDAVWSYCDGYGWETNYNGQGGYFVEPTILTFVNHGCNGDHNIIFGLEPLKFPQIHNLTEQNVKLTDYKANMPLFNPYFDRRYKYMKGGYIESIKDIYPGEELFSNYLFYSTSSPESFYDEAQHLKRMCSGNEVGLVTLSEQKNAKKKSR